MINQTLALMRINSIKAQLIDAVAQMITKSSSQGYDQLSLTIKSIEGVALSRDIALDIKLHKPDVLRLSSSTLGKDIILPEIEGLTDNEIKLIAAQLFDVFPNIKSDLKTFLNFYGFTVKDDKVGNLPIAVENGSILIEDGLVFRYEVDKEKNLIRFNTVYQSLLDIQKKEVIITYHGPDEFSYEAFFEDKKAHCYHDEKEDEKFSVFEILEKAHEQLKKLSL